MLLLRLKSIFPVTRSVEKKNFHSETQKKVNCATTGTIEAVSTHKMNEQVERMKEETSIKLL